MTLYAKEMLPVLRLVVVNYSLLILLGYRGGFAISRSIEINQLQVSCN
jgi:hypothetical protein